MKPIAENLIFIRSNYLDGHLSLEAVHTETDTVFHIHETTVENEREADTLTEAYKRFLSENDNDLRFMTVYLAEVFEVDYKGKSMVEVTKLIGATIEDMETKGEIDND